MMPKKKYPNVQKKKLVLPKRKSQRKNFVHDLGRLCTAHYAFLFDGLQHRFCIFSIPYYSLHHAVFPRIVNFFFFAL